MRSSRRLGNPIFVEEEYHNWKGKRRMFSRLSVSVMLALALIGLIVLITS